MQDTWHDEDALNCLKDIHADLYIMSPDGICDGQYNTSDESENEIKKQFVAMSDRIVAAADGSKMGRPATMSSVWKRMWTNSTQSLCAP